MCSEPRVTPLSQQTILITGATDGLRLRNAGIPVYGVSGLFYPETFAHGMNERIPGRAFYQGLEFMYRLVKGVTGAPRPIS